MRQVASCTLSGLDMSSLTFVMPVQSMTVSGNLCRLHMTHWLDNLMGSTLAIHNLIILNACTLLAKGNTYVMNSEPTNNKAQRLLRCVLRDEPLSRSLWRLVSDSFRLSLETGILDCTLCELCGAASSACRSAVLCPLLCNKLWYHFGVCGAGLAARTTNVFRRAIVADCVLSSCSQR